MFAAALGRAAAAMLRGPREALPPAPMVRGPIHDLLRSRSELLAENVLLRQQLIVASRKVKQPAFRPLFAFFVIDVNAEQAVHVGVISGPSCSGAGRVL